MMVKIFRKPSKGRKSCSGSSYVTLKVLSSKTKLIFIAISLEQYSTYQQYLQARSVMNDAACWTFYLFIDLYYVCIYHVPITLWSEKKSKLQTCQCAMFWHFDVCLMFAHPRLKYTVRFNRVNLTKRNWILFKLSEFESTV